MRMIKVDNIKGEIIFDSRRVSFRNSYRGEIGFAFLNRKGDQVYIGKCRVYSPADRIKRLYEAIKDRQSEEDINFYISYSFKEYYR